MKSIYLYVPDGDNMTVNSVVIWLSVGSHRADRVKLRLLECYAVDCGQFLRIRDDDTDFWLDQHVKKLYPDSNCPRMHMCSAVMPIGVAYKKVIDGNLDIFARNLPRKNQLLNTLFRIDANFMRNHSQKPCITSCPRGKRKNLSHSVGNVFFYATLPFTLLLFVGIVDKLGELIINLLF